jgi:hypothetical protein
LSRKGDVASNHEQNLSAHFLELRKDAFEVIDALRPGHQMLPIKNDSGHTADTLTGPELLFLTHGICKPLIC